MNVRSQLVNVRTWLLIALAAAAVAISSSGVPALSTSADEPATMLELACVEPCEDPGGGG